MDSNNDGKLSKSEFKGPSRAFSHIDSNNDGYLSESELQEAHKNRGSKPDRNDTATKKGAYPALVIKKYDKNKAWAGNVIFVDKIYNRIIEAGLDGRIVWECSAPEVKSPDNMRGFCGAMLTDVEILPNGNMLILIGGVGVYEIDREGDVVWSYTNSTISHDADRLQNGNVVMACAGAELVSEFPYDDPQAIEVDRKGRIVWSWYAKKEYVNSKYKDIRSDDANDWTHMNSVQRLPDGNTLLSVRNWNRLVIADANGKTVWSTGAEEVPTGRRWGFGSPHCPHTPVQLENGKFIVSEPIMGRVIEWDPNKKKVAWSYPERSWKEGGDYYFVRAAHRLPNGNTFIIDSGGQFLEVTSNREIVWHAQVPDYKERSKPYSKEELATVPFFNADRRGLGYYGGR